MSSLTDEYTNPARNNSFGENVSIEPYCDIQKSVLGHWCRLKRYVELKDSTLGDYSYISRFSVVNATDIGKFSSLAHGIMIGLWENNIVVSTHSFYLFESSGGFVEGYQSYDKDAVRTDIGNDVWIGANASVLKGVRVENGAIVGAGSVVTKDIPPYAIVAGNPARVIRYRFAERDIEFLLDLKWWNFPREKLTKLANSNVMHDIAKFRSFIEGLK